MSNKPLNNLRTMSHNKSQNALFVKISWKERVKSVVNRKLAQVNKRSPWSKIYSRCVLVLWLGSGTAHTCIVFNERWVTWSMTCVRQLCLHLKIEMHWRNLLLAWGTFGRMNQFCLLIREWLIIKYQGTRARWIVAFLIVASLCCPTMIVVSKSYNSHIYFWHWDSYSCFYHSSTTLWFLSLNFIPIVRVKDSDEWWLYNLIVVKAVYPRESLNYNFLASFQWTLIVVRIQFLWQRVQDAIRHTFIRYC